jgi:hypothetical protein
VVALTAALALSIVACTDADEAPAGDGSPRRESGAACVASTPSQELRPGAPCPITAPTDADKLPPVLVDEGSPWYGQDELWVSLPRTQAIAPVRGRYSIKFATVTLRDGQLTSEFGPPELRVRRLDGRGTAQVGFGGYATTGEYYEPFRFWPTGIDFSDPGCWLVTGTVGETTIEFVLRVEGRPAAS